MFLAPERSGGYPARDRESPADESSQLTGSLALSLPLDVAQAGLPRVARFDGQAAASPVVASLFSPRENMAAELSSIFSNLEKPILHREHEGSHHRPKEARERGHYAP